VYLRTVPRVILMFQNLKCRLGIKTSTYNTQVPNAIRKSINYAVADLTYKMSNFSEKVSAIDANAPTSFSYYPEARDGGSRGRMRTWLFGMARRDTDMISMHLDFANSVPSLFITVLNYSRGICSEREIRYSCSCACAWFLSRNV